MDQIGALLQGAPWVLFTIIFLVGLSLAYVAVLSRWKKAKGNEVLVVSGTKSGTKVYPGGGTFVSPFQEHDKFTTEVLGLKGDGKEAPTKPKIPVVVDWNAQVRPDDSSDAQLIRAYKDFYGAYEPEEIIASLEGVLNGELRNVIGEMTPEQLLHEKDQFNQRVTEGASERVKELGFKLVNLNLSEVTDKNGYFDDMAAEEREAKRENAANIKADSATRIAVKQAEATQRSEDSRITTQLMVDERELDAALKRAEYKSQKDVAEADAAVAGALRTSVREREIAANQGAVAVVQAEEDQKAAAAQRAAALTRAETERQREVIAAQGKKEQNEIAAFAEAIVAAQRAKGEADAAAATADGKARATRVEAQASADALNLTADAEADKVRKTGLADAEVAQAKGEAEAAAIRAKGEAEAEVQRLMAEALAANEGANLKVSIAEIESRTRIQVATALGTAMHEVGTNATIIDMGGNGSGQGGLLGSLLGGIPELAKVLDVKSRALNGENFTETLAGIVGAVTGKAVSVDPPAIKVDSVEETQE